MGVIQSAVNPLSKTNALDANLYMNHCREIEAFARWYSDFGRGRNILLVSGSGVSTFVSHMVNLLTKRKEEDYTILERLDNAKQNQLKTVFNRKAEIVYLPGDRNTAILDCIASVASRSVISGVSANFMGYGGGVNFCYGDKTCYELIKDFIIKINKHKSKPTIFVIENANYIPIADGADIKSLTDYLAGYKVTDYGIILCSRESLKTELTELNYLSTEITLKNLTKEDIKGYVMRSLKKHGSHINISAFDECLDSYTGDLRKIMMELDKFGETIAFTEKMNGGVWA